MTGTAVSARAQNYFVCGPTASLTGRSAASSGTAVTVSGPRVIASGPSVLSPDQADASRENARCCRRSRTSQWNACSGRGPRRAMTGTAVSIRGRNVSMAEREGVSADRQSPQAEHALIAPENVFLSAEPIFRPGPNRARYRTNRARYRTNRSRYRATRGVWRYARRNGEPPRWFKGTFGALGQRGGTSPERIPRDRVRPFREWNGIWRGVATGSVSGRLPWPGGTRAEAKNQARTFADRAPDRWSSAHDRAPEQLFSSPSYLL